MSPQEAAKIVKDGMCVGCSGFTPSGYPKAVPLAVAERVRKGERLQITLWTGASVGPELDGELTEAGAIRRRFPYQTEERIRKAINDGRVSFQDLHLSMTAQNMRYGFYGNMDLAIVEAVAVTEEGHLIPSTSVGNSPTFVKKAKEVIVEINLTQPLELEGLHDIYIPDDPPNRKPIPIVMVGDRVGTPYIECAVRTKLQL
jgi:succinyl-CoA:acetate CoA-transferase